MLVNEYRQDVYSNNLANADTVGFQRDIPVFAERLTAAEACLRQGPSATNLRDMTGGLWLGKTFTDFAGGTFVETGNGLDCALQGPGFFTVAQDGQTLCTRDGRFTMDRQGRLVAASDGAAVLGLGGMQIQLNPTGGPAQVDTDGRVIQDRQIMGQLQIVDFEDYGQLRKVGASRVDPGAQPPLASPAIVQKGMVEDATVQPIAELTALIAASRSYQMNAQMLTLQDQSVGRLINAVARA